MFNYILRELLLSNSYQVKNEEILKKREKTGFSIKS